MCSKQIHYFMERIPEECHCFVILLQWLMVRWLMVRWLMVRLSERESSRRLQPDYHHNTVEHFSRTLQQNTLVEHHLIVRQKTSVEHFSRAQQRRLSTSACSKNAPLSKNTYRVVLQYDVSCRSNVVYCVVVWCCPVSTEMQYGVVLC